MLERSPEPVSPTDWGWSQETPESVPRPRYVTKPAISRDLPELTVCHCKTACKTACKPPCKCCVQKQPCMSLCGCRGECSHTTTMRDMD